MTKLHQIFRHDACGRSSVLLHVTAWDMLCTSGFVDDVMFSHNGIMAGHKWR